MAAPRLVWIFHASGARFAGGAFEDVAMAEFWIGRHKLTGVLTAYPLDEGCFDWALRTFGTASDKAKLEAKASDPAFVGGFTTASQAHIHFENGKRALRGHCSEQPRAMEPGSDFTLAAPTAVAEFGRSAKKLSHSPT